MVVSVVIRFRYIAPFLRFDVAVTHASCNHSCKAVSCANLLYFGMWIKAVIVLKENNELHTQISDM